MTVESKQGMSSFSSGIGSGSGENTEIVSNFEKNSDLLKKKKKIRVIYFDGMASTSSTSSLDLDLDSAASSSASPRALDDQNKIYSVSDSDGWKSSSEDENDDESSSFSDGPPAAKRQKKMKKKRRLTRSSHKITGSSSAAEQKKVEKETEPEYYVEKIMDMRYTKEKKKEYLVKWLNYDSDENTWEPEENMNCEDLLRDFLSSRQQRNRKVDNNKAAKDVDYANNNNGLRRKPPKRKSRKLSSETEEGSINGSERLRLVLQNKNETTPHHYDSKEDIKNRFKTSAKLVLTNDDASAATATTSSALSLQPKSANPNLNRLVEKELQETRTTKKENEVNPRTVNENESSMSTRGNAHLVYFRVVMNSDDNAIYWIRFNIFDPLPSPNEIYTCVVTEDLTGMEPKLLYGGVTSLDGNKFCMIQFEGHNYVDIIPAANLFQRFPYYKPFFEIHSPSLFSS